MAGFAEQEVANPADYFIIDLLGLFESQAKQKRGYAAALMNEQGVEKCIIERCCY